ncbi:PLP-dependent transferase [Phellopilus nigrolimitatus]|nr:PLP-dependent transferase [Phellopilus nigrolimitatus]
MATPTNEKLPKALDLSHHLSALSRARQPSPLKGLAKYFGQPGIISLSGGMPSAAYFPLAELSAETLVVDSFALSPADASAGTGLAWLWRLFSAKKKERTEHLSIPKYISAQPRPADAVSLDVALQYGTAQGLVPLQSFLQTFVARVYQPQYADATTFVHAGNTDGWSKALQTLCDPGEMILTEAWTYPSALASARPYGVHPASVAMDGEGMRSDDLRKVLVEWDEAARGAKRPHVLYTVPIGQNPTGAAMGATRKKEIYNVCVEFDIVIVEDDPYYFLQQDPYAPRAERKYARGAKPGDDDDDAGAAAFLANLAPSFLKFDYQGRVVRLDTFSKTIAPGARLGWFTCNPIFAERFERQGETSTQAPCGFGQSIVAQLLTKQWGFAGYVRWLRGLRTEYTHRRDFFVDALCTQFDVRSAYVGQGAWAGCTALVARPRLPSKGKGVDEKTAFGAEEKPLFSFVPPSAGMFVWLKIHFENHPSFTGPQDKAVLETKLWTQLGDAGVLVGPGWMFAATDNVQSESEGHMRIAFSNAEYEMMDEAVRIMRGVFLEFFGCQ